MDAILTDSHLDTRIETFILNNVIVSNLEIWRSMGREGGFRKTGGCSTNNRRS